MTDAIAAHDARSRHCPMLGHDVPFAYCRAPGRDLPCGKVADCWWETFDVETYLRTHWSSDQLAQVLAPRPDKLCSLVDLIAKARKAAGAEESP
jgi:hypothetical protein